MDHCQTCPAAATRTRLPSCPILSTHVVCEQSWAAEFVTPDGGEDTHGCSWRVGIHSGGGHECLLFRQARNKPAGCLPGGVANPPLSPFQKACPFGEWNGKFCFCSWFAQFLLVKTTPKQASRLHTLTGVKQKPVQPAIRGDGCNFASWLLAGGRGCLVFPDVFSGESKIVGHGISTTHLERSTVDVVVRDWTIVGPLSSSTWSVSIVVPFGCEHGQVRSEPLSCAEARDSLRFLLQPSSPLRAITWSSSVGPDPRPPTVRGRRHCFRCPEPA